MVWPRECIFRCFYRSAATLQLCCAIPMGLKTAKITKRRWSWNSKTQALPITSAQSEHVAKWKLKNLRSGQTAARFSSFNTGRTDRHIELDPAFLFHWFHWEFFGCKSWACSPQQVCRSCKTEGKDWTITMPCDELRESLNWCFRRSN